MEIPIPSNVKNIINEFSDEVEKFSTYPNSL